MTADRDIALLLDFLNTVDAEEGTDLLGEPGGWTGWVGARELGRPGTARRAAAVRTALRAAVAAAEPPGEVGVALTVRVDGAAPELVGEDAVGEVVAAAARLSVRGDWVRVKICPAHDCRWAFYDRSRNHSRTWCSMQVCGNREKARTFRERRR